MNATFTTIWTVAEWQGRNPAATQPIHKDVEPVAKPEQGNIDTR